MLNLAPDPQPLSATVLLTSPDVNIHEEEAVAADASVYFSKHILLVLSPLHAPQSSKVTHDFSFVGFV